jgi:predicted GIY-YIG superfamily endonuclease
VLRRQNDEGGWTKGKRPWELVQQEAFSDRASAMRREKALKSGRANQTLHRRFEK